MTSINSWQWVRYIGAMVAATGVFAYVGMPLLVSCICAVAFGAYLTGQNQIERIMSQ